MPDARTNSSTFQRPTTVSWSTTIALVIFHAGAIAAPFFFDWGAVLIAAILYWFAISWGIGMGYHRLLTHRGYRCPVWFEYLVATLGTLTLEGGPIFWVATHRIHHQNSDKPGDPHSPRDGAWWSHILWIILGEAKHSETREMMRYTPDLAKHGYYRWLNSYHYVPLTIISTALLVFGGLPYLLWGMCVRVVVGLHATWLVNSATHMWGSRRYETRDDSRNNWWVALLTFGEGWHNNHHAHPVSARHGLAWYEVDLTWMQLRALELIGVISNMKVARLDEDVAERKVA